MPTAHLHLAMSHWKRVFLGAFQKSNYRGRDRRPARSYYVHRLSILFRSPARPLHQPRWRARIPRKSTKQVIARYLNTPAGADAYILLAEAQRKERKFTEATKRSRLSIAKYPSMSL